MPQGVSLYLDFARAVSDTEAIVVNGFDGSSSSVVVLMAPVFGAPGDIDCNGRVDIDDFLRLVSAWGPCTGCSADLDGSQAVNIDDLLLVINNWDFGK